jgi:hypothetical protein
VSPLADTVRFVHGDEATPRREHREKPSPPSPTSRWEGSKEPCAAAAARR